MIKTIIKRSGAREAYNPTKLLKWGEWSARNLEGYVDWLDITAVTARGLPEEVDSQTLQEQFIKTCLDRGTWSHYMMAGRLYAPYLHKHIHGDQIPTVKKLHQRLHSLGFMRPLDYTSEEYAAVEAMIDHDRDKECPHFVLHQVRRKYSLQNRITGDEYETQQFVYMRMAMAIAEDQPGDRRMKDIFHLYDLLSRKVINAPTPNYVNLGTWLRGYASCCLFTTKDDASSLAVGDHIAYMMTVSSAGIGSNINTRSLHDPVRGGLIAHQGRLKYYRVQEAVISANMQNGRGGAETTYYSAFDPEAGTICKLKNPMSTFANRIPGMDYGFISNKFFARKAKNKENIFTFNNYTAPDLWDAMYSEDLQRFEELYNQYETNPLFVKNYVSARELLVMALQESQEVGQHYLMWADEVNRHTPFLDPIYSSNLCAEILEPTHGYDNMPQLYSHEEVAHTVFRTDDGQEHEVTTSTPLHTQRRVVDGLHLEVGDDVVGYGRVTEIVKAEREPEVAMCNIAGIVVPNVQDEDEYRLAAYYALLMIDKCIHQSEYILPHVGVTAKARLNAGVGIMGLAHYMAERGLSYASEAGKQEIHRVAERHAYLMIEASLQLGQELGNAPWIHRTKWVDGWLPIDTYCRSVDNIAAFEYRYDWENLRGRIVDNGGIRNSCLIADMPGESSSKASGTTNSLYAVRDRELIKTDDDNVIYWAAPDADRLGDAYELAWDIGKRHMIDNYAIFQKFADQGISADIHFRLEGNASLGTTELLGDYFYMTMRGLKTRYYMVSRTVGQQEDGGTITEDSDEAGRAGCGKGGCAL